MLERAGDDGGRDGSERRRIPDRVRLLAVVVVVLVLLLLLLLLLQLLLQLVLLLLLQLVLLLLQLTPVYSCSAVTDANAVRCCADEGDAAQREEHVSRYMRIT